MLSKLKKVYLKILLAMIRSREKKAKFYANQYKYY